jgi:hypothetical protein
MADYQRFCPGMELQNEACWQQNRRAQFTLDP